MFGCAAGHLRSLVIHRGVVRFMHMLGSLQATACLHTWVGIEGVVFSVVCPTPAWFGHGCWCYAVTAHMFSIVASFVRMSRHTFPSGSCILGIVSQGAHLRISVEQNMPYSISRYISNIYSNIRDIFAKFEYS